MWLIGPKFTGKKINDMKNYVTVAVWESAEPNFLVSCFIISYRNAKS